MDASHRDNREAREGNDSRHDAALVRLMEDMDRTSDYADRGGMTPSGTFVLSGPLRPVPTNIFCFAAV
ncbi:hypothetical protein [Microvirga zambiensis]|uniref:hypothetical protein n=1 Tax=Microvirga zambiensis TaxID=1402137 RepID=UPI00191F8B27|nr:hypothetical protein [Microvirga zambiensis]